jgi:hypothetical protein
LVHHPLLGQFYQRSEGDDDNNNDDDGYDEVVLVVWCGTFFGMRDDKPNGISNIYRFVTMVY